MVSLCAAPKKKNDSLCERDYLILEKYDWFYGSNQSDQSVTISTAGSKSTVVELEGGRQLLRIHRRSESSLLTVSSDTIFHLGNRATVQQSMTSESDRIEQLSKLIGSSLRQAYQSFGSKDYSEMLKNYYRSYMPNSQDDPSRTNKRLRTLIHRFFMEEQVRLIRETFPDKEFRDILYSLRVFFLNPTIRLQYFNLTRAQKKLQANLTIREPLKIRSLASGNREEDTLSRAATIIQSFFKMILVKRYKRLHDPDHALHPQVRKELLKLSDLFDTSVTSQLLRNLVNRHISLRDLYPCSKDFVHVLNIRVFRGVLDDIKPNQWLPIARFIVNPRPSETTVAAFEPLIDLPRFTLRVFNNRDRREMTRVVNHVAPTRYEYLPTGYTVFAYGWSEKQHFKEIEWEIRVVTMKGEEMLYQSSEQWPPSLQIRPPKLAVEELSAVYIPNARNCISRWSLRATSGSVVSARLATSYNMVKIGVKITDEEGNVLADVNGGSVVLVPLVILEQRAENEETSRGRLEDEKKSSALNEESGNAVDEKGLYYIEAFVLNDSWPLTDTEWTVVNEMKTRRARTMQSAKMQNENEASSTSSDSVMIRRNFKQLDNNQDSKPPYCILQVVTDAKDAVEVCTVCHICVLFRSNREIHVIIYKWLIFFVILC